MARKSGEADYSDEEIEQILGMEPHETQLILNEIRDAIRESPLLVTGLAFAFGILLGASLGCSQRTRS